MKSLIILLASLMSTFHLVGFNNIALAEDSNRTKYECINRGTYFSTVAYTRSGTIEIINWKRDIWGPKWTPERRCVEVTKRFQNHSDQKNLLYISTGEMNNYNVICVSDTSGNCRSDGLLITLESKDDPQTVLKDLFSLSQRKSTGGLDRNLGQPVNVKVVVDVDKDILENLERLISTENPSSSDQNFNPYPNLAPNSDVGEKTPKPVVNGQWE